MSHPRTTTTNKTVLNSWERQQRIQELSDIGIEFMYKVPSGISRRKVKGEASASWLESVNPVGKSPRPTRSKIRLLEIVTAHCIVIAVIVGIGFVWARFA